MIDDVRCIHRADGLRAKRQVRRKAGVAPEADEPTASGREGIAAKSTERTKVACGKSNFPAAIANRGGHTRVGWRRQRLPERVGRQGIERISDGTQNGVGDPAFSHRKKIVKQCCP